MVPGWYRMAEPFVKRGELKIVGIVQDQHADRAKLFLQWKSMDFPILVDSLNATGMKVVPLHYMIDEHGVVRATRINANALSAFITAEPMGPKPPTPAAAPTIDALERDAERPDGARACGDARFHRGSSDDLDRAIYAYRVAARLAPKDGRNTFRLGVALRRRFESDARKPGDFRAAAHAWAEARALDGRQYIWMRRLQQFGPRMTKPYDFYGWVATARADITERGEAPSSLAVEPIGAELAKPARKLTVSAVEPPEDIAKYRPADERALEVEVAVVAPSLTARGRPLKLHVLCWPNAKRPFSGRTPRVLLALPAGWTADRAVADASPFGRSRGHVAEFEVRIPRNAAVGSHPLRVTILADFERAPKQVRHDETVGVEVIARAPRRRPRLGR